jgi:DNA-binding MarR family transcriptional regulator
MAHTVSPGAPSPGSGAQRALAGDAAESDVSAAMAVVERFFRALRAGSSARWLEIDLTVSQLKVMFTLAQSGGANVSEIASLIGIGNAGASVLVDRLVRLDLAERTEDPSDRRRTIVQLSSRGTDLVRELNHGGRERLHRVLAALPAQDVAALIQGVGAAAHVAEELARTTFEAAARRSNDAAKAPK